MKLSKNMNLNRTTEGGRDCWDAARPFSSTTASLMALPNEATLYVTRQSRRPLSRKAPTMGNHGRGIEGDETRGGEPRSSISATARDIPMTLSVDRMRGQCLAQTVSKRRGKPMNSLRAMAARALLRAERIARQAQAENKTDEHLFWRAVVDSSRPTKARLPLAALSFSTRTPRAMSELEVRADSARASRKRRF